ncbi:two-component system sensor histidine kinase KdbD [Enterobacterales bacterium CwR94]|nr:two-component system sensor histidine kinase KdbD [Enterobacterales bacterium CwR94]
MNDERHRPNPDALLLQSLQAHRGKLKIYFGACAGVGKTWAMLQEARRLREQGLDVLVGVVETHGRVETAQLLEGLTLLPRRQYGPSRYDAFDLDAALARHPAVILIDELAHSNAVGARHPKRWQDIEELLEAGIDVMTTVNVQHLESLNDVVSGITGIRVRETVPDPFFDSADEVVLVDLPPDDLRQRLKEGKVYVGDRAERAIENFFRKSNLFALRELALRRTADRVDDQIRAWRDRQGQERVWHTRDAILLCIGDGSGSEKLVRTAARLAARFGSRWHAVYVETPRLYKLPERRRRAILRTLQLAQTLGAETATLSDPDEARAVLRYAREHNLGKVVIGRRPPKWWRRDSFAHRLGEWGPDIDLVVVAVDSPATLTESAALSESRQQSDKWRTTLRGSLVAGALCLAVTLSGQFLLTGVDAANLVMLYLLGVVVVALRYGRWPSVFATVINIIAFDLFFVAPTGTMAVSDAQYLVTFGVMLAVGIITGNLTAGVRYQARVARHREQRAHTLYEMAKSLSSALTADDITATSTRVVSATLQARSVLLLPDEQGELQFSQVQALHSPPDHAIAKWSFSRGQPAGAGTDTLPAVPYQILPVRRGEQTLGLLVIEPENLRQLMIPEQQRLLETFTVLLASALERITLAQNAAAAKLAAEREQLRNTLLSALSHDLRTPLTVLFGQAEMLMMELAEEGSAHAEQAGQIREQTLSTVRLVSNMLDMARIESGGLNVRDEWVPLEEVIGSALQAIAPLRKHHEIALDLPDQMLLIRGDSTLLERVVTNILENSLKYAGDNAQRGIRASGDGSEVTIDIWDSGPGIEHDDLSRIFEKFTRVDKESAIPGVGLGLAICKTLVEMHRGTLTAHHRPQGGALFRIRLPQASLPDLPQTES